MVHAAACQRHNSSAWRFHLCLFYDADPILIFEANITVRERQVIRSKVLSMWIIHSRLVVLELRLAAKILK
jgi:hypothetical protein